MKLLRLDLSYADEIADLERICFSCPWSPESIVSELQNPIAHYYGVVCDDQLVGYGGLQIVLDEGYITNIATAPSFRRRGVADLLMGHIIDQARTRALAFLTLEVRLSNRAARCLYQKHGFAPVGRRRGYYDHPREDALMMTKPFTE